MAEEKEVVVAEAEAEEEVVDTGAVADEADDDIEDGEDSGSEVETADEPLQLDARLKHAAARMSLSDEDVKALGPKAEAVLSKFADSLDAVSTEYARLGRAGKEAETATGEDAEAEDSPQSWRLTEDAEVFSDETNEHLIKPVETKINEILRRLGEIESVRHEATVTEETQLVESFFEKIGDDYGDVYGLVRSDELLPGSPERSAREQLYSTAVALMQAKQSAGAKYTPEEALEDALMLEQKGRVKTTAEKQVADEARRRGKQVGPKPTHRTPVEEPLGEERARKALRAKLAEINKR